MKWAAAVLLFAGAAVFAAAPASIDNAALRFLPAQTAGVVFIDAASLRDAPLVENAFHGRGLSVSGRAGRFVALTGIDPQHDIDAVMIAKLGPGRGFAILTGRIDSAAVEQSLRSKGKTPAAYMGRNLYRDGSLALAVIGNAAVVGQLDAVQKAIEQSGTGTVALRNDLLDRMKVIEPGNQIWAVGEFAARDLRWAGVRAPEELLDPVKDLKDAAYEMHVGSSIHARVMGNFADAKSAEDAAETVRSAIELAKAEAATLKPDLIKLLDGIAVRASGVSLTLDVDASADAVSEWGWR